MHFLCLLPSCNLTPNAYMFYRLSSYTIINKTLIPQITLNTFRSLQVPCSNRCQNLVTIRPHGFAYLIIVIRIDRILQVVGCIKVTGNIGLLRA